MERTRRTCVAVSPTVRSAVQWGLRYCGSRRSRNRWSDRSGDCCLPCESRCARSLRGCSRGRQKRRCTVSPLWTPRARLASLCAARDTAGHANVTERGHERNRIVDGDIGQVSHDSSSMSD